jgi:hypothetical protein
MLYVFQGLFHRSSQCTFNAKTFGYIGSAVCYYLYFHLPPPITPATMSQVLAKSAKKTRMTSARGKTPAMPAVPWQ